MTHIATATHKFIRFVLYAVFKLDESAYRGIALILRHDHNKPHFEMVERDL